jgi:hypothetical protein
MLDVELAEQARQRNEAIHSGKKRAGSESFCVGGEQKRVKQSGSSTLHAAMQH